MKPKMRIVLVAEDRYSAGRWITVIGIGLLILFLYMYLSRLLTGNLKVYQKYTTTDWVVFYMSYIVAILFIVLGIVAHRLAKWPEFVTELYPDGWIREILANSDGTPRSVSNDIPQDLIVATKYDKYKKKYSKRRKMWYIRWVYSLYYDGKIYVVIHYGWLREPDLEKFEEIVKYLINLGERNAKGKDLDVGFSNLYDITVWNKLDYSKKLKEERDKLISGEDAEQS